MEREAPIVCEMLFSTVNIPSKTFHKVNISRGIVTKGAERFPSKSAKSCRCSDLNFISLSMTEAIRSFGKVKIWKQRRDIFGEASGVKWNHRTGDKVGPLHILLPSCSEKWSNFLEMYNLWIKTLLNNWYITSFTFLFGERPRFLQRD